MNFLSAEALAAFDERVNDGRPGVDPSRTSRNLLASQPLAFNLFGHVSKHLDLASAMVSQLVGETVEVTLVDVEHPSPALGDRTAFDVFISYVRDGGTPGALAIETKLTEPFSQQSYTWEKYLGSTAFAAGGWRTSDKEKLADPRWSQLWRNHLLGVAVALENPRIGDVQMLVVHHPEDYACPQNVEGYREHLVDPESCRSVDLHEIAEILRPLAADEPSHQTWLERFEERYLRLECSAAVQSLDPVELDG